VADQQFSQMPDEQSVEEIEDELMVGAGPDQKKTGVVAGQVKEEGKTVTPQEPIKTKTTAVGPSQTQAPAKSLAVPEEPRPKKQTPETKPSATQESIPKKETSKLKPEPPKEPKKELKKESEKKEEKAPPVSKTDDETAVKAKADQANLPYVNLTGFAIVPETLNIIPEEVAKKYRVIPYLKVNGQLKIASTDPQNKQMLGEVQDIISVQNLEPLCAYCSQRSIDYALKSYSFSKKAQEDTGDVEVSGQETELKKEIKGFIALKNEIGKVPTTKLFDVLVSGAINNHASDIHIEPSKQKMRIRYRIDGILQNIAELPKEVYNSLLSRIKFLAKMKIDLKNLPQDGRFTISSEAKNIDLRVSTLPTVYGEGLVMRLLEQDKGFLSLEELGFNKQVHQTVKEAISRPTGMILNTGPTGSGKTTTLYAILDKLNKPGVKIITLEDPVEYRVKGIIQSQVDSYAKYSFARGLRSVLRQDPDVVMVGEIRDLETARIALNAAMTGHLVLSTLHTNNATSAPSRLLEIGVKPFLVAGNINLIIAQRLVRKLCDACKKKYKPRPGIIEAIKKAVPGKEIPTYLWKDSGCKDCQGTGFFGRIPIAETFKPTPKIEKMVLESTPAAKIRQEAINAGIQTMEQDGINKVLSGATSLQEVWRVTKE
jgi:type IV pilus assembly protein PilB